MVRVVIGTSITVLVVLTLIGWIVIDITTMTSKPIDGHSLVRVALMAVMGLTAFMALWGRTRDRTP